MINFYFLYFFNLCVVKNVVCWSRLEEEVRALLFSGVELQTKDMSMHSVAVRAPDNKSAEALLASVDQKAFKAEARDIDDLPKLPSFSKLSRQENKLKIITSTMEISKIQSKNNTQL